MGSGNGRLLGFKQLTGEAALFLRRKLRIERLEGVRLLLADEVAIGGRVFAAPVVKVTGLQFLAEEKGVVFALGQSMVADAE